MLPGAAGGSGSFLVEADDGKRYWCKSINNLQGPKVPVTEQIVGRLGGLIDAATCRVELVLIPAPLVGWEFRPGARLAEGWVHGSAAEDAVTETHQLDHRAHDDNARRHAGYFALYDWLFGGDEQWLVKQSADWMYFSHDHGHYFPGSHDWSIARLKAELDTPHPLPLDPSGLDAGAVSDLASRLEGLTRLDLANALSNLPTDWPVTEAELEAVADFANHRRVPVASRLRTVLAP